MKDTNQYMNKIEQNFKDALGYDQFTYNRPYSTTIEVLGVGHDSRIWVRVIITPSGVICDISTIYFCKSLQKQGLFTLIMNNLMKNEDISEIRVVSVCTDEMHKACRKFSMDYSEESMTYSIKVNE